MASSGEAFLRAYHDGTPGLMGRGIATTPAADGRTSYQVLAGRVAGAQRVLELGCADGALLAVLADNGARELAGVDLSERELALARERPQLRDADLRRARAQDLPFADGSFDAVVSHMALMLMSDVERVVAQTARVLRPGGRLAIAVGAGPVPGGALDLFLSLARPMFAAVPPERRVPPLGDRRTRSRAGLDALLTGFEPVSWEEITLEYTGSPEQVWESAAVSYYDVATLDDEQVDRLREQFFERAAVLFPDGRLTGGTRVAIAATRLVVSPA